jgi:hypothetical protein
LSAQLEVAKLTHEKDQLQRSIDNRAYADLSTSTIDQNTDTNPRAKDMYLAAVQHQWLTPLTANQWESAEWENFSKSRDNRKKETTHIQPAFTKIADMLQSDIWALLDTHNSYNKMTQDYTMHLKNMPASAMSIGLVIELVGQNEDGCSELGFEFPSAKHMSKLFRNMYRILKRCNFTRFVHGVITDLFYIICFHMEINRSNYEVKVTRTPIECGASVQQRFTEYVNSTPEQLGKR